MSRAVVLHPACYRTTRRSVEMALQVLGWSPLIEARQADEESILLADDAVLAESGWRKALRDRSSLLLLTVDHADPELLAVAIELGPDELLGSPLTGPPLINALRRLAEDDPGATSSLTTELFEDPEFDDDLEETVLAEPVEATSFALAADPASTAELLAFETIDEGQLILEDLDEQDDSVSLIHDSNEFDLPDIAGPIDLLERIRAAGAADPRELLLLHRSGRVLASDVPGEREREELAQVAAWALSSLAGGWSAQRRTVELRGAERAVLIVSVDERHALAAGFRGGPSLSDWVRQVEGAVGGGS